MVLKSPQLLLLSHCWTLGGFSKKSRSLEGDTVHHQLQGGTKTKLNMVTQTRVVLHTWVLLNFLGKYKDVREFVNASMS